MKKLLLSVILLCCFAAAKSQPYLRVINNTRCSAFVDFYCWDNTCTGNMVNTMGATILPGTVTFDATAMYMAKYGVVIPPNFAWHYGLIGNLAGCAAQPWTVCWGNHIQMSDGICGAPLLTSGCVNVDAGCNGGCAVFNVTAVYYPNGDCDLTIN